MQAAHPGQRVCLWAQDESRFGLHMVQRRRLTLPGVKPVCPFEQSFENFWLCAAVQPNTGESFVLELRATDSDCLQVFLDQFARAHAQDPSEVQVLLLDNGGAHHAKALRWPERVVPIYLPAYCPELTPIERWWQELKDAVSNQLFGTLAALRARGRGTGHLEPGARADVRAHQLPLPHRSARHDGLNKRNGITDRCIKKPYHSRQHEGAEHKGFAPIYTRSQRSMAGNGAAESTSSCRMCVNCLQNRSGVNTPRAARMNRTGRPLRQSWATFCTTKLMTRVHFQFLCFPVKKKPVSSRIRRVEQKWHS